jgi:hypothetical protein
MKATHYYKWGNEPTGFVSTGYYDTNEVWRECDQMSMEDAEKNGLTFHCPYP